MSKPIEYYLIARNRDTNSLAIVPINKKKGNSLEDIDLFTIQFDNEKELEQFLKKNNNIVRDNNDYFIAYPRIVDGKRTINKLEVLYEKYRVIKQIAINSKNKELTKSSGQIDAILDGFASIMQQQGKLWRQVVDRKTNVYDKFTNYFIMNSKVPSTSIKYRDGGWARASYPLIRNVLEAEGRDKENYKTIKRDIYRSLLDDKLIQMTNSSSAENQISMFDTEDKEDEDKLLEIINTFENLPKNTFIITETKAKYNQIPFVIYRGTDLIILKNNLPERLQYTLQLLAIYKEDYEAGILDMSEDVQSKIRQGLGLIVSLLKNNKELLDKAYEWCQVYEEYKQRIKGDYSGREYKKEGYES